MELLKDKIPQPCLHSMLVAHCASCWYGAFARQTAHVERIRKLLLLTPDGRGALKEHDAYWFGGNVQFLSQQEVRESLGLEPEVHNG